MRMRKTMRALAWGLTGAAITLILASCTTANIGAPDRVTETRPEAQASSPPANQTASAAAMTASAESAQQSAAETAAETTVVTGTRIRRDDYSAVNATVVLTADDMRELGIVSVADMISQLPDNVSSVELTPDAVAALGFDPADLRGLNTASGTRTLVLVDSSRVAPTEYGGSVDLNMIPTALAGQIEAVTGGASATYGADAMAGVVNVIIDDPDAEPRRGPPGRQIGGPAAPASGAAPAGSGRGGFGAGGRGGLPAQQRQAQQGQQQAQEQERARQKQEALAQAASEASVLGSADERYYRATANGGSVALDFAPNRSPLSRVVPGEELWIISQQIDDDQLMAQVADDALGSGVMIARFLPGAVVTDVVSPLPVREIPLPLKHTDVDAHVQGYVGTVDVTQQFENPYGEKIEAVYMFPLPEKAAVSEFVMTIGDRRIRGILRDKQEAQQIYAQARAQGYQASLLTQHRPNVFEQKVANIEPGKQIDVNIRYYETLTYADGWYSFVFPTVVGPRYNPPGSSDPLLALPQTSAAPVPASAVRYLTPGTRSAHDISIGVTLDAGVEIEEIESSHRIDASWSRDGTVKVQLASGAALPNRDFRLDFRVAGDQIKSNLLTYVDEESGDGYFTLMMYPPAGLERLERQPLELVFVLDSSGSMSGAPIEQAKAAIIAALDRLEPGDTFQIIRFSDSASQFGQEPVLATPANIRAASQYVRRLSGSGGTQMIEGIKSALSFPHDPDRLRFVTFLTDGFIGNETDILDAIDARLGSSRIFSFGVGSAPNRYLLERMAGLGRGAVAWLALDDSGSEVMNAFFDRVAHPAMLDVEIDWGGMQVAEIYPRRLPDLFVGRPVVVTGRFTGRADDVRLNGSASGRRVNVRLNHDSDQSQHDFLPNLWARLKIADLNDQLAVEPQNKNVLGAQIRETALAYSLMSDYTSFIAVDASEITSGAHGTTVFQAVPVPAGTRYETTVGR